jgi:hypothetical protein
MDGRNGGVAQGDPGVLFKIRTALCCDLHEHVALLNAVVARMTRFSCIVRVG